MQWLDDTRRFGWRGLVAHLWDAIFRRSCWAESIAWAMRTPDTRLRREAERGPNGGYCPDGVREHPGCWCGKFRPGSSEAN
jgi:hypothetical protein